jgi:hypothetical protein
MTGALSKCGAKAGTPIDLPIEAGIGISIGYIQHLAARESRTGQSGIRWYADLPLLGTFGNAGPKLVFARVVDEQRRALGV